MDNTDQMFARAMRILALVTFLSATAIFMLCYFFAGKFLLLGLGFVVVAALVNLSLFSITLSMGIKQRCQKLVISALLMILNGPVIAIYVWLTLDNLDRM